MLYEVITVFVTRTGPLALESTSRLCALVPVAGGRGGRSHDQLADFSIRHVPIAFVDQPQGNPIDRNSRVITSYSIHYTKLYDGYSRLVVATDLQGRLATDLNTAYASVAGTSKNVALTFGDHRNIEPTLEMLYMIAGGSCNFV